MKIGNKIATIVRRNASLSARRARLHPLSINRASFSREMRDGKISRVGIFLIGLLVLASIITSLLFADWWIAMPVGTQATYVGRESCLECHARQVGAFHDSHHDLAMDFATNDTVHGDFEDATITHHGVTSRMFRDGSRFMIHTEGPDGEMQDFEIKYVFGEEPLQQYMVEFDRPSDMPENEIARLQVLRISWNTEEEEWFYLPPPDVEEKLEPGDPLHWTGTTQNWNTFCADCHSTNLQKNFDSATGIYHTTFSEIDVSCEACHGPASTHVKLARSWSFFWDRNLGYGLADLKNESNVNQVDSCAPCHSRRRRLQDGYHAGKPFQDYFAHELLQESTYHADGQIMDEVYVYGSFVQSKMYHQNIKCTDCHNPHSTEVHFQGNLLCTSCHQHAAGEYDTPAHHHHAPGSPGSLCVNCHMPETTYMEVDPRRDHSLRIPRPDLSVELQTPNACSGCHLDVNELPADDRKSIRQYQDWIRLARLDHEAVRNEVQRVDEQMRQAFLEWYGDDPDGKRPEPFAPALLAARNGDDDAIDQLREWILDSSQPAIIRASSVAELARFDDQSSAELAIQALDDPDPSVVAAAMGRLEFALLQQLRQASQIESGREQLSMLRPLVSTLVPKLTDPAILVRTEAARVLSNLPLQFRREIFSHEDREAFSNGLSELFDSYMLSNDRAMAYVALGNVLENVGRFDDAIKSYRRGIFVEPNVSGPRSNLSALLENQANQRVIEAQEALRLQDTTRYERLIEQVNELTTEAAQIRAEELVLMEIDAQRLPDEPTIQYRLGLAFHMQGDVEKAEVALERAYELAPNNIDYILALALFHERNSNWDRAIGLAQKIIQMDPENLGYQRMLVRIRQGQQLGRPLDQDPPIQQ